jgi:hypothetical protein
MVEGWWCETSRGHFLRRCLNGRAAGALVVVLCWAARQCPGQLGVLVNKPA